MGLSYGRKKWCGTYFGRIKKSVPDLEIKRYKDPKYIFSHIEWRMESLIIRLPVETIMEERKSIWRVMYGLLLRK